MKNNFYIYGLFAPSRIPEMFYIGKGKGQRMWDHFRPSRKGKNPHKDNVMAKYPGCYPRILFANLTEEEAFAIELSAIAQTESLTNLTNGGEGISGYAHTAEAKAKMSKAHKGKTLSEEHRAKLSEAQAGENHPMYGKSHSDETKAKLSEARVGEKNPLYGKKHSDETKAKMSEAHAGEKNVTAKLTWTQVREIRERLATGETQTHLAKEFGVSPSTISEIKNNKLWREQN